MSLFDIIGATIDFVEYTADCFDDMCKGIHEDAKQLGDELIHINDSSYVSPYQKKHDAEKRISDAERRLYNSQDSYRKYYENVGEKAKLNYEHKNRLLGRIEESLTLKYIPFTYKHLERIGFNQELDFKVGEFFGPLLGHSTMDVAASEYLSNAKDYEMEVKSYCAKLDLQKANLKKIESSIDVETELLKELEICLDQKGRGVKKQMAESIRHLIEYAICDSAGNINKCYIDELNSLSRLV